MTEIAIVLDDDHVKSSLEHLRVALRGDMVRPFQEIGRLLKTSTQLRFRDGKGPDGIPWKPSKRALDEHGQTGKKTGRLRNSITYSATNTSVAVGTNVIYAARFHFGFNGDERVREHNRRVTMAFGKPLAVPVTAAVREHIRKVNQVGRPFIGASPQDRIDMLAILQRHLGDAIGGN